MYTLFVLAREIVCRRCANKLWATNALTGTDSGTRDYPSPKNNTHYAPRRALPPLAGAPRLPGPLSPSERNGGCGVNTGGLLGVSARCTIRRQASASCVSCRKEKR